MLDMASKDLFIFFLAAWVSAHRLIDLISESKLITSNTVEIRIFFFPERAGTPILQPWLALWLNHGVFSEFEAIETVKFI